MALRKRKPAVPRARGGAIVHERKLGNGLRVLIAERHADPVVAALLFYGVGSRNETEREAGVSHFLEHMMFKGAHAFGKGEVDRVTAIQGGQNNAFTSYDHTAYWFELASDRWDVALEIEADRMQALALDPAEFDAERAVVLEELAMGEDEPWRVLGQRVEQAVFPRHPYGRPIIGYADSLAALGVDDMRDYYRRFYHPANATLVLCGDVEPRAAMRKVREHFASIPAGPPLDEADCFRGALVEPGGEQRIELSWDDPGRRLCMAWPTAAVASDEDYALDVISSILTGGRLARMQHRLVYEEGLAVSVSTSNDTRIDSGVFWLFAECSQGTPPATLERAVDEELARIATETVPAAELRRSKAILRASEAYDSETVSDVAEELGEFAVDAHWTLALDGCERHDKVTAARVRECAARLLSPRRRVVGWSVPRAEQVAFPAIEQSATRERRRKTSKAARGGRATR